MYDTELIAIETISAVACFILVKFMVTPFRLTKETRYLGLPLGFGFLGASYIFTAVSHISLINFPGKWWIQLFFRAFAFLFLAITYVFSSSVKKHDKVWTTTLGLLISTLILLILLSIISPQTLGADYKSAQILVRVFNLICILYITSHVLKNHTDNPDDTKTLFFPFGYISLGIGQLLQIISAVDNSYLAFWTGIAFRFISLAIFIFISYKIFYSSEIGGENEEN
jgi:hypothetical protein